MATLDNSLNVVPAKSMPSEGGQDYTDSPAKVYQSGRIFFNWQHLDYFNANGSPMRDKVVSTVVHECIHALSIDHTGFQGTDILSAAVNGKAPDNPLMSADEAMTDQLALEVYSKVFGDARYDTGYKVPAPTTGLLGTDAEKMERAQKGLLPVGWTGDLLDIIIKVTGKSLDELKEMYFLKKSDFEALFQAADKKETVTKLWTAQLGDALIARHGIATSPAIEPILQSAIKDVIEQHKATLTNDDAKKAFVQDPQAIAAVRTALRLANVPEFKQASTRKADDLSVTDVKIKAGIKTALGVNVSTTGGAAKAAPATESQIAFTPISATLVAQTLKTVGIPGQHVKIVQAPSHHVSNGKLSQTTMATPLTLYPAECRFGLHASDLRGSLFDLLHENRVMAQDPEKAQELATKKNDTGATSVATYMEGMGGAAYDAKEHLVVATSKVWSPRVLLHELGHLAQETRWSTEEKQYNEYNVARLILEYHNFLKYENLDTFAAMEESKRTGKPIDFSRRLRTSYSIGDAMAGHALGKNWSDLKRDLTTLGQNGTHSIALVAEIEELLETPRYKDYAGVIKSNLVSEYFRSRESEPIGPLPESAHNPASHGHPNVKQGAKAPAQQKARSAAHV